MPSLVETFSDPRILITLLIVVAVFATVITLFLPFLKKDMLSQRMKEVTLESKRIRKREREKLGKKATLRGSSAGIYERISNLLNLEKAFLDSETKSRLRMAGFRGQRPVYVYLTARIIVPIVVFALALLYFFVLAPHIEQPPFMKVVFSIGAGIIATFLPVVYLRNLINKRQTSVARAWPDALDLMLVCVQSGMSVENAFARVSREVGANSIPLAEELALTKAELSYLQRRRDAYENLGKRTGLDQVRALTTSLIQAERYGTPVGQALRVLAKESRDLRMANAERKAAALPPKLTVPMILFFLPALVIVITGPAGIRVSQTF